jgi:hypothetical protein
MLQLRRGILFVRHLTVSTELLSTCIYMEKTMHSEGGRTRLRASILALLPKPFLIFFCYFLILAGSIYHVVPDVHCKHVIIDM